MSLHSARKNFLSVLLLVAGVFVLPCLVQLSWGSIEPCNGDAMDTKPTCTADDVTCADVGKDLVEVNVLNGSFTIPGTTIQVTLPQNLADEATVTLSDGCLDDAQEIHGCTDGEDKEVTDQDINSGTFADSTQFDCENTRLVSECEDKYLEQVEFPYWVLEWADGAWRLRKYTFTLNDVITPNVKIGCVKGDAGVTELDPGPCVEGGKNARYTKECDAEGKWHIRS